MRSPLAHSIAQSAQFGNPANSLFGLFALLIYNFLTVLNRGEAISMANKEQKPEKKEKKQKKDKKQKKAPKAE